MAEPLDAVKPKIEVDKLSNINKKVLVDQVLIVVQRAPIHPDHKEKLLSHLNRAKHYLREAEEALTIAAAVCALTVEAYPAYQIIYNAIRNTLSISQETLSPSSPTPTPEAPSASPALGPQHPDAVSSRFRVAQLLAMLGHTDEALPIARAVAAACEAIPALGPQHPDTVSSRFRVAQLLAMLGHTDEALPIARAVAEAREANPALGPQHPDTLTSRKLVADLLSRPNKDAA